MSALLTGLQYRSSASRFRTRMPTLSTAVRCPPLGAPSFAEVLTILGALQWTRLSSISSASRTRTRHLPPSACTISRPYQHTACHAAPWLIRRCRSLGGHNTYIWPARTGGPLCCVRTCPVSMNEVFEERDIFHGSSVFCDVLLAVGCSSPAAQ